MTLNPQKDRRALSLAVTAGVAETLIWTNAPGVQVVANPGDDQRPYRVVFPGMTRAKARRAAKALFSMLGAPAGSFA